MLLARDGQRPAPRGDAHATDSVGSTARVQGNLGAGVEQGAALRGRKACQAPAAVAPVAGCLSSGAGPLVPRAVPASPYRFLPGIRPARTGLSARRAAYRRAQVAAGLTIVAVLLLGAIAWAVCP